MTLADRLCCYDKRRIDIILFLCLHPPGRSDVGLQILETGARGVNFALYSAAGDGDILSPDLRASRVTRGEEDWDSVTGAGRGEDGLGALARGLARGQGRGWAHWADIHWDRGHRIMAGDLEARTRDEGHDDEEGHSPCTYDHIPAGNNTWPETELRSTCQAARAANWPRVFSTLTRTRTRTLLQR